MLVVLHTLLSPALHAHGDLHDQIESLTAQIHSTPDNSELWFRRGLLHEQHGDHQLALTDFDRAETLNPAVPGLAFARARAQFGSKKFPAALSSLDAVPREARNQPDWFLWKARTLQHLDRSNEAVAAFTQAISRMNRVSPDVLLERAECQLIAGQWRSAVAGLNEGIELVGPVLTLHVKALAIERDHDEWTAALNRLDTILTIVPGSPDFLFQKGDVLNDLGRQKEALDCFRLALKELETLPDARRRTPNHIQLTDELRRRITALPKPE